MKSRDLWIPVIAVLTFQRVDGPATLGSCTVRVKLVKEVDSERELKQYNLCSVLVGFDC